jgi:GPH family glycoside/pentoside/hexuronide:cation symporter
MSQITLQRSSVGAAGRLSTRFKLIWGIAGFGTSLISGIFGALLPIFYQDYLGLAAGWIALASGIYAVWNAINDPLFGYISDITRSRLGRRIPYMRFTAPFLALTFILVWFAPPLGGQLTIFWWMLISMVLYDGCYTIIGLAYSALLPELTESDQERNGLQISSSLFGMFGMLLGFIIPDLFRPKAGMSPSLLPLQMSMIVVAMVCAVFIIITTYVVKERREFYEGDKPLPLGKALTTSLTSRSFQILAAQNFMSVLVSSLVVGSVFYLTDYLVPVPTMVLLACIFVPLLIGIPLTTVLRARLGVVGAQQLLLLTAGTGLLLVVVAPPPLIPVCLALAGLGLAGPQTLTNVLFAEVIDEDEIRSGVRREGAFFGINALVTKPAQSIAITLSPFILTLTHFVTRDQNGGQIFLNQPASALLGIRIIVGLVPGLAMLLGALILRWFPLRGRRLEEMQRRVLIMHANKHARLNNPS